MGKIGGMAALLQIILNMESPHRNHITMGSILFFTQLSHSKNDPKALKNLQESDKKKVS